MDYKAEWCARIALFATLFFFIVMYVAFPFIQPELNPLYRFGSEYAVGPMGWLMKLNFFVWGGGLFAFALGMAIGVDSKARSRIAVVLFMLAGVGVFLSGVFDSNLQVLNENPPPRWIEPPSSRENTLHAIAGLVTFFSLMSGAGLVARRLRIEGRLNGVYRWLRVLSWLLPVAFVCFVAAFIPNGLGGLGQRIFIGLVLLWVILAARGLQKGAFVPQ